MVPKILVTGVTGGLGRSVLDTLLQHVPASMLAASSSNRAKAILTEDKGVEFRWADFNSSNSLHEAFKGIEKLFFVSSPEVNPEKRTKQHSNVVEAAKAAGIKHVCLLRRYRAHMRRTLLILSLRRSTTAPLHSADLAQIPKL